ncbi:MAG: GNAT family N-acetyltransferase [Mangrovibacterium sp.]
MITLYPARLIDIDAIWKILQDAILRRKLDGSIQWQDGYPNLKTVKDDIESSSGYVLKEKDEIIAYVCIKINDEPAYDNIDGKWLSESDYLVIHRLAIATEQLGKGFAKLIFKLCEEYAFAKNIHSIKVDTNFDNCGMLHILSKSNYIYCGEVIMRGGTRKAFEKTF